MSLIISFSVLSYWQFANITNFFLWFYGGLQLSSGYSSAMSLKGPSEELLLAAICIVSFGIVLFINYFYSKDTDRYLFLILFLPMFLFFKHGFVRQDAHVFSFFSSYVLLLCTTAIFINSEIVFKRFILLVCIGCLAYISISDERHCILSGYDRILGKQSFHITKKMFNYKETLKDLKHKSRKNLEYTRLKNSFVDNYQRNKFTFDSIPWLTSIIFTNNYAWQPAPIFQHDVAFTHYLDNKNAQHYLSKNSADIVICCFQAMNKKHLLWSTPATWKNILLNYYPINIIHKKNLLILKKLPDIKKPKMKTIKTLIIEKNEWLPIPSNEKKIFLKTKLKYNIKGLLSKNLFRVPPVYIQVIFSKKKIKKWRIIPEVMENGILINPIPDSLSELEQVFKNNKNSSPLLFRICGPGTNMLKFPAIGQFTTFNVE
ncbi:MAG: hypothetical protein U9O87_06850 [Verrucomicrobiota bacterium]|nr:hypothetical protein [Verrucomicrobiota bacterium]